MTECRASVKKLNYLISGREPCSGKLRFIDAVSSVGAGLLAKASCQSLLDWLIHRFREQARSHRRNRRMAFTALLIGINLNICLGR
ncbi:hypothetical protein FBY06_12468 [Pseudomonas sp. SJZ085]|nr:hypothetical protein FBY00_12417 [Pseudomonas sp. SJZ075]TWC15096.1 hypothetical protein FBX99_12468 [Pseudomonas sp. SJZ074]TWC29193.1 hypothetical protein FBY02_12417 [Pseudomonas sp. SJZ078]TWC33527.1 hypothetical protein FBY06_12468 [Pseudomonas sp. SJZ085]TWC49517.1 hypothetical protein FBY11_12427 [Pseudomonas sp. SJZ124]TWC84749.1 hypothetical protein FBY09_12417 [Pseudomonas sp. SJZ101]